MYDTVLFDLDGTLTDPALGITNSVMYALKKWNIEVTDRSELYKFIGPPLIDAFEEYYGFSREDSILTLKYYREYFSTNGLFENEVYDGIDNLLCDLKKAGKKLLVATSKPEVYAKQILEHFDLLKYFDFVAGATLDEKRVKKDDVIEYALESCNINDCKKVVMVGDRKHDVLGAKKFGIDTIGVLFGYGSRDELSDAGAVYIAENIKDISDILFAQR